MLGLYLASPLDRGTYLLGKTVSVLALLAIVTIGPPIILVLGYATQGYGPQGIAGWFDTIWRIVLAGVLVSAVFAAVSLAISSVTSRKGVAAASVLVIVFGSLAVVSVLIIQGGLSLNLGVFNIFSLPFDAVYRVFDEPSPFVYGGYEPMSASLVYGANVAWVLVCAGVVGVRYRTIEVSR